MVSKHRIIFKEINMPNLPNKPYTLFVSINLTFATLLNAGEIDNSIEYIRVTGSTQPACSGQLILATSL